MFKYAHLYWRRICGKVIPMLYEEHTGFGNFFCSSEGLSGIVEELVSAVHISFGVDYRGSVDVRTFPPTHIEDPAEVFSFSVRQRMEFENLMPDGVGVRWVASEEQVKVSE